MFPFQMNDGHTGENWFPLRTGKGKHTKLAGELHVASQWLENGMLAGAKGSCLVVVVVVVGGVVVVVVVVVVLWRCCCQDCLLGCLPRMTLVYLFVRDDKHVNLFVANP